MPSSITRLLWLSVQRLAFAGAFLSVMFGLCLGLASGLEGLLVLVRLVGDTVQHLSEPVASNIPSPNTAVVAWGAGGAVLGVVTMLAGWWGVRGLARGSRASAVRGALLGLAASAAWYVVITFGALEWSGFELDLAPRLLAAGQAAVLLCSLWWKQAGLVQDLAG